MGKYFVKRGFSDFKKAIVGTPEKKMKSVMPPKVPKQESGLKGIQTISYQTGSDIRRKKRVDEALKGVSYL